MMSSLAADGRREDQSAEGGNCVSQIALRLERGWRPVVVIIPEILEMRLQALGYGPVWEWRSC